MTELAVSKIQQLEQALQLHPGVAFAVLVGSQRTGQPVRIYDLARRMVELSGLSVCTEDNPEGDIEIAITGLRPGEKLYEELLIGMNPQRTQHARIMQAHEEFLPWPLLEEKLQALNMAVGVNDVPMIRGFLQQLVKGYAPAGEVVDWVHLAHEREARASGLE